MSDEKPTMSETLFAYCVNIAHIDDAALIISKLLKCDKVNPEIVDQIMADLKTIRMELDNAFDAIAEDDEPENVHVNDPELTEETMGDDHADEEGDTQPEKPIDFEDVR